MKLSITKTTTILGLIGVGLILSSCNNWHYKHPRVRIDINREIEKENEAKKTNDDFSVEPLVSIKEEESIKNDSNQKVNTSHFITYKKKSMNKESSTHQINTQKKKAVSYFSFMADQIQKQKSSIREAKSVEKQAMAGWVRIMIILFAIGLILLLVGVFLTIFVSGAFWWLFYGLGALLILAGFIILILGLIGVL